MNVAKNIKLNVKGIDWDKSPIAGTRFLPENILLIQCLDFSHAGCSSQQALFVNAPYHMKASKRNITILIG